MSGVNKVILVGRLGQDPELRYAKSGQPVCNLSIATSEMWNDKDGNRQERTEWHRIVVWGHQAEACGKYLAKGREVYVEGRIQSGKYTDRDGNERKTFEIVAQQVNFLGSRNDGGGGSRAQHSTESTQGGGWGGGSTSGRAQHSTDGGWSGKQGGGVDDDPIPF